MKVEVGPYTYRVLYEEPHLPDAVGETEPDKLVIRIAPHLPAQRRYVILWHETLHCLFDVIGNPLSEEQEEQIVDRLAPALVQLLAANPTLRG